jgi:hypothetical protein
MRYSCLLILIGICGPLFSQVDHPTRIPGELIVQLAEGVEAEFWHKKQANQGTLTAALQYGRKLGIRHSLFLLRFAEADISAEKALKQVESLAGVVAVQYNYVVDFREQPNDNEYFRQWDMQAIGVEDAWRETTGGATAKGTPIVVAVMDSGFEITHEDLQPNLWQNLAEIPGDGIDNDGNGYVDDVMGWDFFSDTPNIAPGNHGLSTAAIVGARGNNGVGVTGVNWEVELMLFSFSSVADLITAYEYAIDQRQRFNESNGTEGAFVVATNNSFGQARVWCDQQPVWASMYDLLGQVGILSSSGVDNNRYDVDTQGDMPATCPSDYLLISCNTDEDDNLYTTSAYGRTSVDIGSPGEGSYTAKPGNSYGFFGDNSAATPHVTGAIALLYSAPCEELEALAIEDPAATALLMKKVLIEEGEPLPSLENRTVSGRRLNVANALEAIIASCRNQLIPLALERIFPNPVNGILTVDFAAPVNGTYQVELFNALGQITRRKEIVVGEIGLRTFTFDTKGLATGVYFLRFGQNEEGVTKRVVVY